MVLMCVNNVDSIIMSIANPVNMEIIVIVIMIIIQMHQSDHFHCHRDEDEDDDDARASERYCLWGALIMAFCSQNHGILQDFHVQSLWRPVPGWVYLMV